MSTEPLPCWLGSPRSQQAPVFLSNCLPPCRTALHIPVFLTSELRKPLCPTRRFRSLSGCDLASRLWFNANATRVRWGHPGNEWGIRRTAPRFPRAAPRWVDWLEAEGPALCHLGKNISWHSPWAPQKSRPSQKYCEISQWSPWLLAAGLEKRECYLCISAEPMHGCNYEMISEKWTCRVEIKQRQTAVQEKLTPGWISFSFNMDAVGTDPASPWY